MRGNKIVRKWVAAVFILGSVVSGPVKADVVYAWSGKFAPSTLDLDFIVAAQLFPTNSAEPLLSTSGVFASHFTGGSASYLQRSPGSQPEIVLIVLSAGLLGLGLALRGRSRIEPAAARLRL